MLKQGYVTVAKFIFRVHPTLIYLMEVAESVELDEVKEGLERWPSNSSNNTWLSICDKENTPKLPQCYEIGTFGIELLLPKVHHGAILVTTRSFQLRSSHTVRITKLRNIYHSPYTAACVKT
jgi:hypothetical protein